MSDSTRTQPANNGAREPAQTYLRMYQNLTYIAKHYDDSDKWISESEQQGHSTVSQRPIFDPYSNQTYLEQHLTAYLTSIRARSTEHTDPETGRTCLIFKHRQVRLPEPIRNCLRHKSEKFTLKYGVEPWYPQNMTVAWLVTYLDKVYPDTSSQEWQKHTCSHICLSASTGNVQHPCISSGHMVWEAHSVNISRGFGLCRKPCQHHNCNKNLCNCAHLHTPTCI